MSRWIREIGNVTFTRITKKGEDPRVEIECKESGVTVSILKDPAIFTQDKFIEFCTPETAERIVKEYITPLLEWTGDNAP